MACSRCHCSAGPASGFRRVSDDNFRPAASHIRRGSIETDRLSTSIGHHTQRKQIGKTEGSLDVEPVIRFQPDADRECCRGKAL
jgi:hypothetical protein